MDDFEKRIAGYIKKNELIRSDDKLLIAVSGGADSLALLHFLVKNGFAKQDQAAVIHINHMLREEAEKEAAHVAQMAAHYQLPIIRRDISVGKLAAEQKIGVEEAARLVRYQQFEQVMQEQGYNKLVLAHHADDQIETILMRLVRGSSSTGWSGMAPSRLLPSGQAVRPLLAEPKAALLAYCEQEQISYCVDASNQDPRFTRNRYRADILPFLQRENPAVHEHFNRFSMESRADFEFLEEMAGRIFEQTCILGDECADLAIENLKNEGMPLQRRVIHLLLKYLYKDMPKEITSQQQYQILEMIHRDNPSAELHLSKGLIIRRSYERLSCFFEKKESSPNEFYYQMVPGDRIRLFDESELQMKQKSSVVQTAGLDGIIVNAADVQLPLIIRSRMPGDRIKLKGTGGTKKLKDIFIDVKVPKYERDQLPVITDSTGKVLWVPGIKKSNDDVSASRVEKQYIIRYNRNLGGNKSMHNDIQKVLISEEELQKKIRELGAELTTEYDGRNPLVIGVLKGATPFMTDLIKRVDTYLEMDFMDVSSYGNGMVSSGEVKIIKDLNTSVDGRDVLIVEDIIDSGRTLSYLVDLIKYRRAKSVKLVTLLDKPEGRNVDIEADYVGFIVPNEFVVGYGLDYAEKYRNLPYIGVLKPEVYSK
ncbi:hypoxanthine phosphoribosyltransferase [Listeria costaricensis]|uniref:hypoxanthine phosphoribosyltransferase n=1 Tax=Listeria costaricensis TaxID=2026604 RepID=UPI000C07983C|nr:hypoxanthine phosphoribosyltransferase [Listeria costaricensis]